MDLHRHIKSIDNALQRVKRKLEKYMESTGNEVDIATIYKGLTSMKRKESGMFGLNIEDELAYD